MKKILFPVALLLAATLHAEPTTMPTPSNSIIVNTRKTNMSAKNRPDWCQVTGAGVLKGVNSGHFDRHYHDCNEYWMIVHGKAKVWLDGKDYYLKGGDIFCIKAGLGHGIPRL